MVLYLKSKETDKYKTNEQDKTTGEYITKDATFYSVAKIPSGENGVAEFDMSDVPASGYEAYAWIELTKEDGMTYISNPASFTVIRGHDVLFRETEGVKFLDEYGNEITETRSLKDLSNPNPHHLQVERRQVVETLRQAQVVEVLRQAQTVRRQVMEILRQAQMERRQVVEVLLITTKLQQLK